MTRRLINILLSVVASTQRLYFCILVRLPDSFIYRAMKNSSYQ